MAIGRRHTPAAAGLGVLMDGTASAKYSPARCAAEGFLALNLPSRLSLERLISIVENLRAKICVDCTRQ
jgi:hypothetical protein